MLVRESSFCLKASPSTGSLCNDADLTRPSRLCRTAASANKALAPSGFTGGTLFFGGPPFFAKEMLLLESGARTSVRSLYQAPSVRSPVAPTIGRRRYNPRPHPPRANPHPAAPSTSLRASVATLARQSVFFARHSPSFASLGRVRTRPPVSISFAGKRNGLTFLQASFTMITGWRKVSFAVYSLQWVDEPFRRYCI